MYRGTFGFVLAWLGWLLACSLALAQPVVKVQVTRNGVVEDWPTTFSSGQAIALTGINDDITVVRVFSLGSPGVADVGRITLGGTRPNAVPLDVLLTTQVFDFSDPNVFLADRAGNNWAGIALPSSFEPLTRLAGAIAGNLTSAVQVGEVYRLQVDGNVEGRVTGTRAGFAVRRLIVGGSIMPGNGPTSAKVEAWIGDIDIVRTGTIQGGGGIYDRILAENGSINSIQATGPIEIVNSAGVPYNNGVHAGLDITEVVGFRIAARIVAGTMGPSTWEPSRGFGRRAAARVSSAGARGATTTPTPSGNPTAS